MARPISENPAWEIDSYVPPSPVEGLFMEQPVDLTTFIQDSKYLGLPEIELSPIQYNTVRIIERVYFPETYELLAEHSDTQKIRDYWSVPLPVKNLISAAWGKGSSCPNSLIYSTQTGKWVRLRDWVTENDYVASHNLTTGEVSSQPASSSFVEAEGRMFQVRTKRGLEMRVWEGHRFLTRTRTNPEPFWARLWDLRPGDYIATATSVPEPPNPLSLPDYVVEFLALTIANGSTSGNNKGTFTCGDQHPIIREYVRNLVRNFSNTEMRERLDLWKHTSRWHCKPVERGTNTYSRDVWNTIKQYGLDDKTAHTKTIPEEIFQLSNRQIALFLSRLIDTDGSVSFSNVCEIQYSTVSKELAYGVQRLALRLGVAMNISKRVTKNQDQNFRGESYTVRVRDARMVLQLASQLTLLDKEPARLAAIEWAESRTSRKQTLGDILWDKIEDVEYDGDGEYWSLTEPTNSNYVANGGIVNRNSGKDAIARFASLRIAYMLLCLKSPQEYFSMPAFDSIHLLNIAANSGQANQAFFKPMTEAVKRGWLKDYAEPKQGLIEYDKNIFAISGHSDAEGQEGLNILLGVADEIDAFRTKDEMVGLGKRSREASTSAESILKMLKGSASAQPLDAKVLTPSGWTTMGALKVGDAIVDPMGDSSSVVTGIFPQGVTPVYELTFSDKSVTRASHHHLWEIEYSWAPTTLAERKAKTSKSVRKTVTTDWLVENLPKFQRWNRPIKIVPTNIGEYDFHGEELFLDPYLVGALLGDGGLTHYSPTFTSADQQMFDLVEAALPDHVQMSEYIQHEGCRSVRLIHGKGKPNPLTEELKRLGMWGKHSYDKSIPEAYKWATSAERLALLQGLLDTDGTVGKTGADFTSTSEKLALEVRDLARSLGLSARIFAPQKPSETSTWVSPTGGKIQGKRLSWKVSIGRSRDVSLFRLDRKAKKQPTVRTQRHSYSLRAITRIEDDVTQCIKVSAASELYVTDDWIVTHNTRFARTYKRVVISYPRYIGSAIQRQTDDGNASIAKYGYEKSIYHVSGPHATWEVNPRISGKEDFAEDYDTDPDEAASMYECKPKRAVDPYFKNPQIFAQAVDRQEQPISVDYKLVETVSEITGSVTKGWEPVFTFAPDFFPVAGARYAMHGDLAVRGDRAGISMSHIERMVERSDLVSGEDGIQHSVETTAPVVRNDFTISFSADPIAKTDTGELLPREIQIRWARALCFELIKRGFWIGSFTFDGFQSTDSMQILQNHGIVSKRLSTDLDIGIWRTLKDIASDSRLRMPYSSLMMIELEALSKIGPKVDHPPNGSKDLADAFACSIVGALALGGAEAETGEPIQLGETLILDGSNFGDPIGALGFEYSSGGLGAPIGMEGMSFNGWR